MSEHQIPTREDLKAVVDTLCEHPGVMSADTEVVIYVKVELLDNSARERVYELEQKIMRANRDLLFDFHTVMLPAG